MVQAGCHANCTTLHDHTFPYSLLTVNDVVSYKRSIVHRMRKAGSKSIHHIQNML